MSIRPVLAAVLATLVLLAAAFAQQAGAAIGWYNGEWRSGSPGSGNWYVAPDKFVRVYDQFQVPAGGWTVLSVFSDNALYDSPTPVITHVSWEIRRGMAPGNPGEIVAADLSPASQLPDPFVKTGVYPPSEIGKHFRIQVDHLRVQLPAGHYWISVTPLGRGQILAHPTLGKSAVGIDQSGLGMALVDDSSGPRFTIAESVGKAGQMGIAKHFAQGVIVAK